MRRYGQFVFNQLCSFGTLLGQGGLFGDVNKNEGRAMDETCEMLDAC